ncbi:hypothetical protein ACVGV4_00245, partial [Enterobacter hormaechei]
YGNKVFQKGFCLVCCLFFYKLSVFTFFWAVRLGFLLRHFGCGISPPLVFGRKIQPKSQYFLMGKGS